MSARENTVFGINLNTDSGVGNAASWILNPAGYQYYNFGRGDTNADMGLNDVNSIDSYTVANYRPSNWLQRVLNPTGVAQEEQRYNNALDRLYNASEAEKARQFNAEQAKLQREYEERLSNSAYSRAAADLQSIGVNPYVLLNGMSAASTPSGAAASGYGASHSGNASFAKSSAAKTLFNGIVSLAGSAISAYSKLRSAEIYAGR